MSVFDIWHKEIDTEFMEAELMLDNMYLGALNYLTEDGDSKFQTDKNVDGIITKIRKAIQNMVTKINSLFADKKIKDVEDAVKENPDLANAKVQIKKTDELDELANKTCDEIKKVKSKEELEAKMNKYRKQRNKILASSAVVTITLAALLVMMKKNKDVKIKNLTKKTDDLEKQCKVYSKKVKFAAQRMHELKKQKKETEDKLEVARQKSLYNKTKVKGNQIKRDVDTAGKKFIETAEGTKAIISANAEILKNATHDIVTEAENSAKAVVTSKSKVQKVTKTIAGTKAVVDTVKNTDGGVVYEKQADELKRQITKILETRKKAEKIVREKSAIKAHKTEVLKARTYLDKSENQLRKLKIQYDALKKHSKP